MVLGKKNFLILGFTNRTGFHVAKFLVKKECNVFITDKVRDNEKEKLLEEVKEVGKGNVIDLLGTEDVPLNEIDIIISSPGVPLENPIIQSALKKGIEVIGDIELFYNLNPNIRYFAITGTDGKTTTTNLTYQILKSHLPNTFMAGNVGIPIFSLEGEIENLVVEISSFQIDTTKLFRPFVGAITNIAKDHLDRYYSFEDYTNSKFSLFKNSKEEDFAILNISLLPYLTSRNIKPQKIFFSAFSGKLETQHNQVYLKDNFIFLNDEKIINTKKVKLIGKHNIENIMIAVATGKIMNIPNEKMEEVVYNFTPLPHRMEFVRELNGIKFINDSKATTINAMISAIKSIDNPIILIVGGLDKGMDFSEAIPIIKEKVKYLIA
ncbi:MAG: UDP-N-acetylmuramoyl-L-alanine--D-glutamate ligase, partial [Brevinematia bacterium]